MDLDMPVPLCLVENTDRGLVVCDETVKFISQIRQPLVVVSVVGPYRTGKSFLMNRLMGRNAGFALGSTIQAKTKGIWVWCRRHPTKHDHCLMLLDTEGLGDVEKGSMANDNWIFTLAVLLGSTFVYNCLASLQNDAIEKLHYITKMTELVKVRSVTSEEDGTEFVKFFPSFVWTVRDFTLQLEINGKPVTADEYLMHALSLKQGTGARVSNYNLPRECILNYFKEKKCFVFSRPVTHKNDFKEIERLPEDRLDPDFLHEAGLFTEYIFNHAPTKTIEGRMINGSMLGSLLSMYVETIKSGRVPCLENAVDTMSTIENTKAIDEGFKVYKNIHQLVALPMETAAEVSVMHQTCEKEALDVFLQYSFNDENQQHQKALKAQIAEEYEALVLKNYAASREKCQEILKEVTAEITSKMMKGSYTKAGGYKEYDQDKTETVHRYNEKPGKGVKAEEILEQYLKAKEAEGANILAGDKAMTEKEKEIAAQKQQAELNEQKQKSAEEDRARIEQLMRDQESSNKIHIQQLEEKMKTERRNLIKEQERILDDKMRTQEKMMKEGFQRQSDQYQRQITDMHDSIEAQKESGNIFTKAIDGIASVVKFPFKIFG